MSGWGVVDKHFSDICVMILAMGFLFLMAYVVAKRNK